MRVAGDIPVTTETEVLLKVPEKLAPMVSLFDRGRVLPVATEEVNRSVKDVVEGFDVVEKFGAG